MARKKSKSSTPIEAVTHKDKRTNIPTEELRDFVAEDETQPAKMTYPRDTSLDPQLVWQGKDEQDQKDLEVPVVPIYIQEKVHPKAIIENLRETAKPGEQEPELTLFDDFNGIEFEDLIDFYAHEQNWSNRMILGDSLTVMASLAEKEGLKGKVQMIYLDPPYGIKFGSNWQVSTRKPAVKDGRREDLTRQPEQVKAFRDTWELGIHSYLAYMRDRLAVARELVTESGSVFVQIGDENVHLVRSLMDEVFGSENFISTVFFRKTTLQSGDFLPDTNDYLLWYARNRQQARFRTLFEERLGFDWVNYDFVGLPSGEHRKMTKSERGHPETLPPDSRVYRRSPLTSTSASESTLVPFDFEEKTYSPGTGGWKTNEAGLTKLRLANRLEAYGMTLSYRRFTDDFPFFRRSNAWTDTASGGYSDDKVYVVQTNTKVVQRCLLMTTDPGDLVLDPTCGSGTTAYVAEQWGRRWITVDTSRVALALARTRLMSAKFPYYLLADSPDGEKKQAELEGTVSRETSTDHDVRKGFVYKSVPHVTLKSIANNPDITEGMSREAIDAAIAKHADKEILYDQPYEDKKRLRVTGPFTVESLSPHRIISDEPEDAEERPLAEVSDFQTDGGQYETTILENLRRAGVQNTYKGEALVFDRLEPYAGEWIHAEGDFTDKSGETKRVAVSLGPEHGTVGRDMVKEAAKEAVTGIGFDILVVCGFAFDPSVPDEAKRYGKLTVLPARMNPDLAMGDELLKKTGSGNLFMVFGEPDITIKEEGGQLTVEIRGLDVYDPTTGQIRSNTTDDIACWFVDTAYNGESFFVRHAYFTGADKPYDKLERALKAEVDEAAWSSLYSTVSRPFDKPTTNKIAVKVINHYGDEVLKVYEV